MMEAARRLPSRNAVARGDVDRFLMVQPLPGSVPDRLRVITGWGAEVGLTGGS